MPQALKYDRLKPALDLVDYKVFDCVRRDFNVLPAFGFTEYLRSWLFALAGVDNLHAALRHVGRDLCPPNWHRALILQTARVLAFGAEKYERHNWRKGMRWTRLAAAALRHHDSWQSGEIDDPESGLPHLGHAACCLMFLSVYQREGLGEDDR